MDAELLPSIPGIADDVRPGNLTNLSDHAQLGQQFDPLCFVRNGLERFLVLGTQVAQRLQPAVDKSHPGVRVGRLHATTGVVTADHDVLDLESVCPAWPHDANRSRPAGQ